MEEVTIPSEFVLTGTSRVTSEVNDVALRQGPYTRLILRSQLVVNERDAEESVKACLMHQRRHSLNDGWQDADSFNPAHLSAGQEVRMRLDAGETRKLYDALTMQYALPVGNDFTGQQRRLTVVDAESSLIVRGKEKQLIEELLKEEGEHFWDYVEELRPGILETVQIKRQHESRLAALEQFEARISDESWGEGEWQSFFEAHKWIFGQSLAHQVLFRLASQPVYGGMRFSGQGSQRGDYLLATMANAKFTVLVEIKKPNTALVGDRYRNNVRLLGEELVGGVAQLQSNCQAWTVEGSRQAENATELENAQVFTYQPKGILVIGNTSQLKSRDMVSTFELFRRELRNPEIMTFDELVERARMIVEVEEQRVQ